MSNIIIGFILVFKAPKNNKQKAMARLILSTNNILE